MFVELEPGIQGLVPMNETGVSRRHGREGRHFRQPRQSTSLSLEVDQSARRMRLSVQGRRGAAASRMSCWETLERAGIAAPTESSSDRLAIGSDVGERPAATEVTRKTISRCRAKDHGC